MMPIKIGSMIKKQVKYKETPHDSTYYERYFFLQQKSEPATQLDVQVGQDLQDTLVANAHACVGMAANMIGIKSGLSSSIWVLPTWSCTIPSSSARPSLIRQKRAACR